MNYALNKVNKYIYISEKYAVTALVCSIIIFFQNYINPLIN